ncbi:AAA family ATPase [Kyrpidia tusciae]|uniref:ATPase associated with various cellular activities AAA_5 n=1 Tax=Kyrpidia tusciae (strain DSM 2912 / NBRC 15312 / T2) TaxID=562970 RepID=D5WS51_KYRT2|nr:MoxR family ATPase [Kyrpidia tusciae]ADG07003.1 ATPase associated with various cellular activities AAA_5 [Kyrpidia tusciae DSM 2912]
MSPKDRSPGDWMRMLEQAGYVADESLAGMVRLAVALERPLLLEGPAGSGKTSLADAVARALQKPLVRLQCFEGLDASQALYDWNYHKQMVDLARGDAQNVFTEAYLLERPLMRALRSSGGCVLLIDEVDRADEGFEALLLEVLADYRITVPEWGTVTAREPPVVFLTSNRTRPLSDALRRRSLYTYVDWPDPERECAIVRKQIPGLEDEAVRRIVRAVQMLRGWDLLKPPGVAETLDWARAFELDGRWSEAWIHRTIGCVIKEFLDIQAVTSRIPELLDGT